MMKLAEVNKRLDLKHDKLRWMLKGNDFDAANPTDQKWFENDEDYDVV
jgi:hypothetical protein